MTSEAKPRFDIATSQAGRSPESTPRAHFRKTLRGNALECVSRLTLLYCAWHRQLSRRVLLLLSRHRCRETPRLFRANRFLGPTGNSPPVHHQPKSADTLTVLRGHMKQRELFARRLVAAPIGRRSRACGLRRGTVDTNRLKRGLTKGQHAGVEVGNIMWFNLELDVQATAPVVSNC